MISSLSPHNQHLFASYLFLLWYDESLWRCFELILEEIQFFPFLSHVQSSHVRFLLFITWNVHIVVFPPIFVFYSLCCLCCVWWQKTSCFAVFESFYRYFDTIFNAGELLLLLLFSVSFQRQHKLMVFQLSLRDSKSSQVLRALLSILADSRVLNLDVLCSSSEC